MIKQASKSIALSILCALAASPGLAQTKIVSPSDAANVEGNASVHNITGPVHVQQLYPASEFSELPEGGAWLIAFAERADRNQRRTATINYDALNVTFSTTVKDDLSMRYADNTGADAIEVIDGPQQVTYEVTEDSPNPFSAIWEFEQPFFYDPTEGNLLLQFTSTSGGSPRFHLDSQRVSYRSEIAGSPGAATAKFSTRTSVVEQFIFVAEEQLCVPLIDGSLVQPGDLDLDGQVAFADFLTLSSNFGLEGGYDDGDVDCSGSVGFPDFLLLAENFTGAAGEAASVPEPTGGLLASLCIAGLVGRRRRR